MPVARSRIPVRPRRAPFQNSRIPDRPPRILFRSSRALIGGSRIFRGISRGADRNPPVAVGTPPEADQNSWGGNQNPRRNPGEQPALAAHQARVRNSGGANRRRRRKGSGPSRSQRARRRGMVSAARTRKTPWGAAGTLAVHAGGGWPAREARSSVTPAARADAVGLRPDGAGTLDQAKARPFGVRQPLAGCQGIVGQKGVYQVKKVHCSRLSWDVLPSESSPSVPLHEVEREGARS